MPYYKFFKSVHGAFLIPEMFASMLSTFFIVFPIDKYQKRNVDLKWETAFLYAVSFYCFASSTLHFFVFLCSSDTAKHFPKMIFYLHHHLIAASLCLVMGSWEVYSEVREHVSVLNLAHYTAGMLTLINFVLFAGGFLSLYHEQGGNLFTMARALRRGRRRY
ncbi:uncharacterized protein LOC111624443 [Centruroides sculpturatus]|uniref:uncharacterized protein LOC111624443 n=1 Tax=Centruroides sculpturatus TaxID=218467 RepID=UPI000C6E17A9|nr:uncharacterized protein LOC111624443 [Centruroides sculpturatus]